MDNDHLFVCFSPEALARCIGEVPFRVGIEEFARNLTEQSLTEYYDARARWHWYPIISRGFESFSTHSDLAAMLEGNRLRDAIGWAAKIASQEEGQRFISALGLLSILCRSEETPAQVKQLTEHFMTIREKVVLNAIDPNIGYWFSKIALFQLKTGVMPSGYTGTFDRAGLNAPTDE